MKYRRKPLVIEAKQWHSPGDHDAVKEPTFERMPRDCKNCVQPGTSTRWPGAAHGWIEKGGHLVCPGDWIITGIKSAYYPCSPHTFRYTYDAVDLRDGSADG